MDGNLLGGLLTALCALPGVGIGIALLSGKWRPASLAAARRPERARVAAGAFVLVHALLVVGLGSALAVLPPARMHIAADVFVVAIVVATTLGAVLLAFATRSGP